MRGIAIKIILKAEVNGPPYQNVSGNKYYFGCHWDTYNLKLIIYLFIYFVPPIEPRASCAEHILDHCLPPQPRPETDINCT